MTPTVGVVVPLYDSSDTITATLASLATQTRPPDQVVVVDDGSSDGGSALVEPWSSVLPLTLIRHETNRGLAMTRCTAIDFLETDLVALLDADDVWLPDGLQLLVTTFDQRGGLISGNGLRWVSSGAVSRTPWHARRPIPAPADQLRRLAIENFVFIGSLFERLAYHAVGGFRSWPKTCEDWDLWLRFAAAGHIISAPEQPTALYRLRPTSMSAGDKTLEDEIEVLERLAREHPSPDVLAATRTGLRHRRARQGLKLAYERAGAGDRLGARRAATRALQGNGRHVVRGGAMLLAPSSAFRRRAQRHAEPDWVVNH